MAEFDCLALVSDFEAGLPALFLHLGRCQICWYSLASVTLEFLIILEEIGS